VIADKKTGFALWKLNHITYSNDLKWTKPGHITLKLSKSNLGEAGMDAGLPKTLHQSPCLKKRSSFRQLAKLRPLTGSFTSSNLSSAADSSLTESSSSKDPKSSSSSQLFMALKFDDEFECSKFYDFYRVLFTDAHNDDLFNPHYKPSSSSASKQSSLIKVIYKKITKNSISSPVAFKVINSLSSVDEEAMNSNGTPHCLLSSSSDTHSIHSSADLTTPSSSMLTLKRNLI